MFINSTALFNQVLVINSDTVACYNKKELKSIAIKLTHADECDKLHMLDSLQILNLEKSLSLSKDMFINSNKISESLKNNISLLEKDNKKLYRKNRFKAIIIKLLAGILVVETTYLLIVKTNL